MGIVIRRNPNQLNGRRLKETTQPSELDTGTAAERRDNRFVQFDFTGYHRFTPRSVLDGRNGSGYSRQIGKNGVLEAKGIDWFARHSQRLEMMLSVTGESTTLLRRMWTGERAPSWDRHRGQTKHRDPTGFGGSFVGGYVKYNNTRKDAVEFLRYINSRNAEGRIFIRVSPTNEDLLLKPEGMYQDFEARCWSLPIPILKDRDILIRYDPISGDEAWRYEVLNVTRNVGFLNKEAAQQFQMKRFEKTDPIYNIRLIDLEDGGVGDLAGGDSTVGTGTVLSDQIEKQFGDGYSDRGFSQGYNLGYTRGHNDGISNKDFIDIPDDNIDALLDEPYGQNRQDTFGYGDIVQTADSAGVPFDKQDWLYGYREGYKDGYRDGQEEYRKRQRVRRARGRL